MQKLASTVTLNWPCVLPTDYHRGTVCWRCPRALGRQYPFSHLLLLICKSINMNSPNLFIVLELSRRLTRFEMHAAVLEENVVGDVCVRVWLVMCVGDGGAEEPHESLS